MKYARIFSVLLFVFSGCAEQNPNAGECNTNNPLEMLWLADKVRDLQNCPCRISVFQAEYNGNPVFWGLMNDPLCQSVIDHVEVYNCQGDVIEILENYNQWVDFNKNVSSLKIIYICDR